MKRFSHFAAATESPIPKSIFDVGIEQLQYVTPAADQVGAASESASPGSGPSARYVTGALIGFLLRGGVGALAGIALVWWMDQQQAAKAAGG